MVPGLLVDANHFFGLEFANHILDSPFAHPRESTKISIPPTIDARVIIVTPFSLFVHHTIDGILSRSQPIRYTVQDSRASGSSEW
jgi:hypothetical protein